MKVKEAGVEWVRMGKLDKMSEKITPNIQIAYWNKFKRISFGERERWTNVYHWFICWWISR